MRVFRSLFTCLLATAAVGSLALPAAAASSGSGPSGTADTAGTAREVQHDLDLLTRSGAVGAQVRVTEGGRSWLARSGSAERAGRAPVPREGRFRIGSATKMFTSVVLLQLVGQGEVALDAPLSRYLPLGLVPQGDRITARMALQHTSGLHDTARDLPQGEELVRTRFRHYDAADQVRRAAAKPADFPPGTGYGYSNTNYLIAGLIIERVTGHSYAAEVRERIIAPLGLHHTFVPGDRTDIPGPHAHGYLGTTDITALNPSFAGPAGEIVSTPRDMDRFLTALTSGELLLPVQWKEMNRTVATGEPGERYGLGLKERTLSCGRTAIGHTGGIPGYATLAFTTRDGERRVVLSANLADWPADERIGEPIGKVLDDALCG
ncbi:serine hydrolase domain-containing protein [Streptomyces sp. NPDC003077]|uniref:serine hydrolase domain-containing protein n=1 Tax=Streptomyces sp. NPDC003077 TaxID=3154443 RepID=UPI0033A04C0A